MIMKIGTKALIPNPALKPFEVLIGEWKTTGSHPYLPDTVLHGRVSFEWLEGGAFLLLRSEIDEPRFPHDIEIFGSDDVEKKFFMLHFGCHPDNCVATTCETRPREANTTGIERPVDVLRSVTS
jgi:hypothetical protein